MQKKNEQVLKSESSYSGSDLSDAARKMRSGDTAARREGAAELGKAGGRKSHSGSAQRVEKA